MREYNQLSNNRFWLVLFASTFMAIALCAVCGFEPLDWQSLVFVPVFSMLIIWIVGIGLVKK